MIDKSFCVHLVMKNATCRTCPTTFSLMQIQADFGCVGEKEIFLSLDENSILNILSALPSNLQKEAEKEIIEGCWCP